MALGRARLVAAAARCRKAGLLTLAAGTLTVSLAAAAEWHSVDDIRGAAAAAALRAIGSSDPAAIDTVGVDERLRLPACAGPLDTALERPFANGRGTVAVACTGPQPWRLFVPVRAVNTVPVVVLRRGVQRGEVLEAADLAVEPRSSATLPHEYVLRPEDAVGSAVRRTIPAGAVLVPGALERATLVERGALVTLVSAGGAVLVRGQGIALESAGANERVRVRTASGRIVEGTVSRTGEVRVGS